MRRAIRMFVLVASFATTLPCVAQITVTGADPSSAAQGTTNLDVTISGNGFKKGAKAAFHVHGTTNNGGVTVNSTSFSNGSSLTTNISIATDADISNYDVEVINSDGRTGVGSEAFAVVQSRDPVNTTTTIYNHNGATPYVLQSDGNSSASYSADIISANSGVTDELDLLLSHSRFVVVTLVPLDNNSAAAAPFVGTMVLSDARIESRCFTPAGALQDWTQIQPGYPDDTCAMRVEFSYKRVTYGLVMSPVHPGTGTATVSCTRTSSNSCVAWTDVPNSSAANPNVAFLLDTNGNYIGSYSLTFNITVTSP